MTLRRKKSLDRPISRKYLITGLGVFAAIIVGWGVANVVLAKISAKAVLASIKLEGEAEGTKTVNDGCKTYNIPFGGFTACGVRSMKAYRGSGNYRLTMLRTDRLIQSEGWKPDAFNYASNVKRYFNSTYEPFSMAYAKDGQTLALFSLKQNEIPSSGDILDMDRLSKVPLTGDQYIYGIQVSKDYSAWPNRFLPGF